MKTKNIASIISFFIATCGAFLPFNFIIGSKASVFSYASMAIPALGFQAPLFYIFGYCFIKSFFSVSLFPIFLLHRLPLFIASFALRFWDFKISVIVPLCMILLFSIHPVGFQVFYYAWYWFVPIIIYLCCKDTIYNRALIAAFVAHAVGSVIWLYCIYTEPKMWIALMPLVFIERLIIAAGMIAFISLFYWIEEMICQKVIV